MLQTDLNTETVPFWTLEQLEKVKTIKNPDICLGLKIMSVPAMTNEQREQFCNSYFVDEFPEKAVIGDLIVKDGIEYIYNNEWVEIQQKTTEERTELINDVISSFDEETRKRFMEG